MNWEVLKKGTFRKMKPYSKPKKTKGDGLRKLHFEKSEFVLSTDIDEN
jgi:hypothetical protein